MSTLKMTFSLASLILILGLVLVTAPAMAQTAQVVTSTGADTANSTRTIDWTLTFATGAGSIPAGGYLIVHKGAVGTVIPDATALGSKVVTTIPGTVGLPDLEKLFFEEGGTILLQASVTNVNDAADVLTTTVNVGNKPVVGAGGTPFPDFRYDDDGDDQFGSNGTSGNADGIRDAEQAQFTADGTLFDSTAPTEATHPATKRIDVRVDDLSITEIMWALDNMSIGQTTATNPQWIEIHNRNQNAPVPLDGLVLTIQSGHPPTDLGDDLVNAAPADAFDTGDASARIGVDRIENVNALGKAWEPKGQSGNSTTGAMEPFVSMYRTRSGDQYKVNGGSSAGAWTASTQVYLPNYKGTPGRMERAGVVTFEKKDFTLGDVIINEVSNRMGGKDYEWIELMGPADKELKNWQMSLLTDIPEPDADPVIEGEVALFTIPNEGYSKIPESGILLVVNSDPSNDPDHPLAAGWDITKQADAQARGVGAENPDDPNHDPRYVANYIVLPFSEQLPDDGDFVLVLRNGNDKIKQNAKIVDMAGYESGDLKVANTDPKFTNLWPLTGDVRGADLPNNKFEMDTVHQRQKADIPGIRSSNYGRKGDNIDGNDHRDTAFADAGFTGIGYKRRAKADAANGGTPGYPNNAIKNDGADAMASVIISEIMYARDERNRLPQWVELRNMSDTIGVNVGSWRLEITNHHEMMGAMDTMVDWDGEYSEDIDLSGTIPPGQTYLIVARKAESRDGSRLPTERVIGADKPRNGAILNPYGFQVRLIAKRGEADPTKRDEIDIAGNLMPKDANSRRTDAQSFNDDVAWNWPNAIDEDGNRVSVIRIPTNPNAEMMAMGTTQDGWLLFTDTDQYNLIEHDTHYGDASDVSSPGHHHGGVLPVSLSKFRPERMKDTGAVVIRWITESELNNAGFNILRSETRDGKFKRINTKLIAGQGTTSERTVYEYADTSAKPNVVYYYQIQDVSLDGQVTTLRTTHLRGNVTAAGKLTTTWGELKALQ